MHSLISFFPPSQDFPITNLPGITEMQQCHLWDRLNIPFTVRSGREVQYVLKYTLEVPHCMLHLEME